VGAPFTARQAKTKIDYLFKNFWPVMEGVTVRYGDCLAQLGSITTIMNDPNLTNDDRLVRLDQLGGVGPTIASGLLWSFFPDDCVPFDKHTMGYCTIDWKVISSHRITDGTYSKKCATIVASLLNHSPAFKDIDALVRYAAQNRSVEVSPV
jgi:hypothetical protein